MKILQRQYLKEFAKLLLLLSFGLSSIFSLIDLTGKIDDFMKGASIIRIILYAALSIPKYLVYLLPMSVLMSGLYTFSIASHRREITAIKSAGGRLRVMFYPFVAAGVLVSMVSFFASEVVIPECSKRTAELRRSLDANARRLVFTEGGLWLKAKDGSPVKIDLYVMEKKLAKGVSIFVLDNNSLKERLIAQQAMWNGSEWILENITKYEIATGRIEEIKSMAYPDLESPEYFTREIKPTDEMGAFELYRYMQRLKDAGFRNVKLAVDINSKISFPLINFFMMLLGIALALRVGFGGGLFSAGLGLLISLLYWFSYTFALSMGYAGIAPPFAAAWLIPVSFGALSVYLFVRIPE